MKWRMKPKDGGGFLYFKDGNEISKEEWNKNGKIKEVLEGSKRQRGAGAWPKSSDALAVEPGGAKEAYEASVEMGVPTQFDERTGKGTFTSQGHMNNYMKAFGYCDNDAGYGQVAPKNY